MKNFRTSVLVTAGLLLMAIGGATASAQAGGDSKELVKRAYSKMNAFGELPKENDIYRLEYELRTFMRDSLRFRNTSVFVKMKMGSDKFWYDGGDMEVHQDSRHSCVLIKSRKTLYLRDSDVRPQDERKKILEQLLQNNDRLFLTATVVGSDTIQQGRQRLLKVSLRVAPDLQKLTGIQMMICTVDPAAETLYAIRTEFTGENNIAAMEAVFHVADTRYKEAGFHEPVYPAFFTATGTLRNAYSGYTLVDVRMNK